MPGKEFTMPAITADCGAGFLAGRSGARPADQQTVNSAGPDSDGDGPPERITVNVIGRASRALDIAAALTGDSKTDTLNRALQVYAYLTQLTARGGSVYVREATKSALEPLKVA
jgi:hypothetical protein